MFGMPVRKRLIAVLGAAFGCLIARPGFSQMCSDTTMFPNPIYIAGSTAYQPTAKLFAAFLASQTDASLKATIIYQNGFGSCDAPVDLLPNSGTGMQPGLTGTAAVWTPGSNFANDPTSVTNGTCMLDGSATVDVGISDIFWDSCVQNVGGIPSMPTTIKDFQGPVQAMIFVVAKQNTSFTAMSAAEAQLIWGCGSNGLVSPFDDVMGIQQRSNTSGTQGIVSAAIGVPAAKFFGNANAGTSNVLSSIATYVASHDPNKAIGFIAGDAFDANRSTLYPVAFEGTGQTKAYYADSQRDKLDRANVRDGHYVVWGPEHFLVKVDGSGVPTTAAAQKFLAATLGTTVGPATPPAGLDNLKLQALAGVIPQCAMKVTRSTDGGNVSPNSVSDPCGCFFEKTKTGITSCTACAGDGDCSGGKTCHHGYCE